MRLSSIYKFRCLEILFLDPIINMQCGGRIVRNGAVKYKWYLTLISKKSELR